MHAARATCQGQVVLRRSPLLVNTFTTRSLPWTWMTAWICALMCLLNLDMNRLEVRVFSVLLLYLKALRHETKPFLKAAKEGEAIKRSLKSRSDCSTRGKRSLPSTATPSISPISRPRRQPFMYLHRCSSWLNISLVPGAGRAVTSVLSVVLIFFWFRLEAG